MRAEIVLNQHDLFGVGKMQVGQFFQHLRVIADLQLEITVPKILNYEQGDRPLWVET